MDILKKIGKYEVVGKPLGQGGMGVVYRAVDPEIGRPVAIKMMRSTVADNPELIDRFYREVKATAMLRHPNIVTVYDWGKENGLPYIVMEFLEGSSLEGKTITAPSPYLAFSLQLNIVSQVCAGLHYAHEQGVVHRDIKPANIFLLKDQSVKIVDFGIAHLANKQVSSFTKPGQVIGTLFYMSPEQLQGSAIDRRTDIYSTGIVLYELLTNELPFRGPDETSTRTQILTAPPPPLSTHLSEYPPELQEILDRALAKSPLDRYQTAEDFAFDLSRIQALLKPSLIGEWLEAADSAIDLSDWAKAKEYLAEVLKLDAGHAGAHDKLRQVQEILGGGEKSNEAQRLRAQAEDALAEQRIDDAVAFAEQAASLDPSNLDLRLYRDTVRQRKERAAKAKRAADRADACFKENQLDAALTSVNEALSWDDANAQARALQAKIKQSLANTSNRKRLQDLLEKARKAIADGKFISALELLKQAEAIDHNAPELAALKDQATKGRDSGLSKVNGAAAGATISWKRPQTDPGVGSRPSVDDSDQQETVVQKPAASAPPENAAQKVKFTPPVYGGTSEPARVSAASSDSASVASQSARKAQYRSMPGSEIKDSKSSGTGSGGTGSGGGGSSRSHWIEIAVGAILSAVISAVVGYWLLHETTVNVTVETTPPGATVLLAGEGRNESCVTPKCVKSLPKGTYQLSASLEGYVSVSQSIEATSKMPPVKLELMKVLTDTGYWLVLNTPGVKGASAYLDNKEYPLGNSDKLRLPVDKSKTYAVKVQKDGYVAAPEQQVKVANKEENLTFRLKPRPDLATVSLRHSTPDALVMLDSKTVGSVKSDGSFETKTSPGTHTVQLTLDGRTSNKLEKQVAPRASVVFEGLLVASASQPQPAPQPQPTPPQPQPAPQPPTPKPQPPPAPKPPAVPGYCPMPARLNYDFDSSERDKIGVWKGAWTEAVTKQGKKSVPNPRKFCLVITSFRGGEAQGIFSTEKAGESPASWRAVTGAVSGQGNATIITFTTAGDDKVVKVRFVNDGPVEAIWSQPSVQFTLSASLRK